MSPDTLAVGLLAVLGAAAVTLGVAHAWTMTHPGGHGRHQDPTPVPRGRRLRGVRAVVKAALDEVTPPPQLPGGRHTPPRRWIDLDIINCYSCKDRGFLGGCRRCGAEAAPEVDPASLIRPYAPQVPTERRVNGAQL